MARRPTRFRRGCCQQNEPIFRAGMTRNGLGPIILDTLIIRLKREIVATSFEASSRKCFPCFPQVHTEDGVTSRGGWNSIRTPKPQTPAVVPIRYGALFYVFCTIQDGPSWLPASDFQECIASRFPAHFLAYLVVYQTCSCVAVKSLVRRPHQASYTASDPA
jgi:hypothetical protein